MTVQEDFIQKPLAPVKACRARSLPVAYLPIPVRSHGKSFLLIPFSFIHDIVIRPWNLTESDRASGLETLIHYSIQLLIHNLCITPSMCVIYYLSTENFHLTP